MKRFLVLMIALMCATTAMAQSIDALVLSLEERTVAGNKISVVEDSETRAAVSIVEAQRRAKEVSGFRIVIFSNNGQYAGDNAEEVLTKFRESFPHINAYLVYESPYFKVSVGDCLSMEEAQILMAELLPHYPKAYPKRETISYEHLATSHRAPVSMPDSLPGASVNMPRIEQM